MADHSADRPCSPDCYECCRLMIDARDQRRFDKATESLRQQLDVTRAALAKCGIVLRETRLSLSAAIDDLQCANRLHPDEISTDIAAQNRPQQLRDLRDKINRVLTNPNVEHIIRIETARDGVISWAEEIRDDASYTEDGQSMYIDPSYIHELKERLSALATLSKP